VQIGQELAEIHPFVYISRWWLPPSWISKNCYFWLPMTLILFISVSISNLVQIDQELANICHFVYFLKWRPPPSWFSKKWHFGPLMTLVLTVSISTPNLVQIDQQLAEIHSIVYFSRWRSPPSWISEKCYFWHRWHLSRPYLSAHQIWCKLIKNWTRCALLCIFQDDGHRHLEFPISDILDHCW